MCTKKVNKLLYKSFEIVEKNKLLTRLGSVCIMKNFDLRLENATLGLQPWATFSRLQSVFFTIKTRQLANNIILHIAFIIIYYC